MAFPVEGLQTGGEYITCPGRNLMKTKRSRKGLIRNDNDVSLRVFIELLFSPLWLVTQSGSLRICVRIDNINEFYWVGFHSYAGIENCAAATINEN